MIEKIGSYHADDVTFLLKEISSQVEEVDTEERERLIQSGVHYSEMLPVEYEPTKEYISLFHEMLDKHSRRMAFITAVTAERIWKFSGKKTVLVSLARAGTPAGVLLKRYLRYRYEITVPHYSISIIRGKGIDKNALDYIVKQHGSSSLVFIDGWTGKGAITGELQEACELYSRENNLELKPVLAVLADPGYCANISGTFDDFLIPNACLNATVSGLLSRTFHRSDIIASDEFHGVRYYKEKESNDFSNIYVDRIEREFQNLEIEPEKDLSFYTDQPRWSGMKCVEKIQEEFDIDSMHRVKPGVGETTRVLLRRVPWKVLIRPDAGDDIAHIIQLAQERNVAVELYPDMPYSCCGIIKKKRDN